MSIGVDRANVGPIASQVAGFCGAFAGALVAQVRKRASISAQKDQSPESGRPASAQTNAHKPPAQH